MSPEPRIYLDTSALLKLYLPEPESQEVEALLRIQEGSYCSTLCQAEFASTLERLRRDGKLSEREAGSLWDLFQKDLQSSAFSAVETGAEDIRDAIGILKGHAHAHRLRTLDAVHLATARNLGAGSFLTFDVRQRAVAGLLGFDLPLPR